MKRLSVICRATLTLNKNKVYECISRKRDDHEKSILDNVQIQAFQIVIDL